MALWGNKDDKTSTGTVQVHANGDIAGTSTLFDTEALVGDHLVINSTTAFIMNSITSNTVATVIPAKLGTSVNAVSAGANYTLNEKPLFVSQAEGLDSSGNLGDQTKVFGIDTTESGVGAGPIVNIIITDDGSGYNANGTVTISGGGGSSGAANAQVSAAGRVSVVNITNAGSSYETNPSVAISAPAAQAFNALTAVANTGDTITLSGAGTWAAEDEATYLVAAGNTAVGGLANGTTYFIQFANSTVIKLSETKGGAAIDLTASVTETGHTLTGETATASAVVGGASNKGVAHAGWVRRIEGTGGRAGRVQYEVLVAGSSISGDAADDAVAPDS
jgi:hypothetical protein